MATITVNGNTIDPGYHDLNQEQKTELAGLNVEIQEYVAEYHAELKATSSLKYLVENEAETEFEVDVILHERPNVSAETLAPTVAEIAGLPLDELEVLPAKIRLVVHRDKLDDLAGLDSVDRIKEVRPKDLYNDHARVVLHADLFDTPPGCQGNMETICVADTGFDQGQVTDKDNVHVHPAFIGRIDQLRSLWNKGDARDPVGHGTHVCGSIVGDGYYQDKANGKKTVIKGTAPAAKIMVQGLSQWSEAKKKWIFKAPADITKLFTESYQLGIRIHSNSWGDTWDPRVGQLGYEAEATAIDKYVCEHLDFVVLVAAGNDAEKVNHGNSQIGDNSAAKNCITAGATGSTRPNDGQRMKVDSSTPSGISDTAIFSSRGPTKATVNSQGHSVTGRIKPDVVAPGVAILSAASRALQPHDWTRVRFGVSGDQDWLYMSGSSIATPLVTGCIALIREALREKGKMHPSTALIKAILVNGAVNQTGGGFDYEQGFGRVDVNNSIAIIKQPKHGGFIDCGSKLESSEYDVPGLFQSDHWQSDPIPVPADGSHTFVATLVYPDAQVTLLQNDLNLIVRSGDVEMHGNMGQSPELDHTNKIERVVWKDVPQGSVTVTVKPYAFLDPLTAQSFAVAWSFRGEE